MRKTRQESQYAEAQAQPPAGEADPRAALEPATATTNLCPECGKPYVSVASTHIRVESDPTRHRVLYQHQEVIDSTGKENDGPAIKSWGCLSDTAAPADTPANPPEIISPKTPPNISNPTNVANAEEIEQLEREIDAKATQIIGQFTDRIEYELLPLLYRMRNLLPHGEWGNWFDRFRKRVRLQWTMRTVQRKFKELEDGWNDDPADDANNDNEPGDEGQEESEDASTPAAVCESPKELLTKWMKRQRKVLSGGDGPVDADPIRDGERRVDTGLQMLDELKLAVDEGLLDELPEEPVVKGEHAVADSVLIPWLAAVYRHSQMEAEGYSLALDARLIPGDLIRDSYDSYQPLKKVPPQLRNVDAKAKEMLPPRKWRTLKDGKIVEVFEHGKDGYRKCPLEPEPQEPAKRCLCNRFPTGVIEEDYVVLPLPRIAELLMEIADELYDGQHGLDGFAEQIESIAFWLNEREELDRRMRMLGDRVAKRPEAAQKSGLNWDATSKELRRDRRNQNEMRILLQAGCKTYMSKPIKGNENDPWVERFTREQVKAEMTLDFKHQLGVTATNEDYMPGMILEDKVPPLAPISDEPTDDQLEAPGDGEDTAATNDKSNLDSPIVPDDAAKDEAVSEMSREAAQITSVETDAQREATTIDVSNPAAEAQTLVTIEPAHESIGIPGCTYIYAPAGKAGEYAPLAANPYRGCGHGCSYCYVPLMLKMKRPEFDAGAKARPDFLKHLAKDARKYQAAGITEQVFFSFTTDVYSTFDTSLTRPSLEIVQQHGMGICVLTKGGTRALADIDLYRPNRDCFASTLTSLDESFQKKWERNAASPDDRITALKAFHREGRLHLGIVGTYA